MTKDKNEEFREIKLNRLKSVLIQFNKRKVGDVIDRYLEAKEKFQQPQYLLQQQPQSIELQQVEQVACSEFNHYSKMHDSFLRQRSKVTWLRFGDDNTSYFYATLKQRSAFNRITAYLDEHGKIVDCYDDVVNHFINHFKGFLGSPSSATSRIQLDCFKVGNILSLDQQLSLIRPFSKKDVKMAMFSIHAVKSPGPEGFGSGFFKYMWKDLGDEIATAMMCVRLSTVLPFLTHQNQGAFIKQRSQVSGLAVNLSKSHIYFGGVHLDERKKIMDSLNIEEGSFPLNIWDCV
ncbi:uncharacterized protein LOC133778918 [Humulus lupulus]|uniref:uncharacterized protein LOC133778918 n=1 Tax=Humulus lupulus TaxID=3486 RepID=UPI002B4167BC|nr:uncharacterized protein LOC133778918 [Humulus lupulus]